MRTRLGRLAAALGAVVALAVGGSAFALAGSGSPSKGSTAQRQHVARSHAAARQHARGVVLRKSSEDPSPGEQRGENESSSSDSDNDAAAQAAACQKAGIDPNGDHVQYDDQTGSCSLDTGGNNGP